MQLIVEPFNFSKSLTCEKRIFLNSWKLLASTFLQPNEQCKLFAFNSEFNDESERSLREKSNLHQNNSQHDLIMQFTKLLAAFSS